MLILEAILLTLLATRPPAPAPPKPALDITDANIADNIRLDIETIAGPGSVDVTSANGRLFNVRIAVPTLRSDFCQPIYDRELKLDRLFPEYNFDFYLWIR